MKYEIIKGSAKDFEGAPEWALLKTQYYYFEGFEIGLKWAYFYEGNIINSGEWTNPEAIHHNKYGIIAERRPITEPVFSVEWLPPVGSRIEYTCIKPDNGHPAIEFGNWYGGTVIAYYEGFVWTSDNGIRRLENTIFRPMKSPEDVARDEAIKGMGIICKAASSWEGAAKDIYNAIDSGRIPGITKTPTVSELMRVTEKATREECGAIVKLLSGK